MGRTESETLKAIMLVATATLTIGAASSCKPIPAEAVPPPAESQNVSELVDWLSDLEDEAKAEAARDAKPPNRLRNPFSIDSPGQFTPKPVASLPPESTPAPPTISGDAALWWQHTQRAANGLSLESVLYGSRPLVTIRGSILGIGESVTVAGVEFVVRDIKRGAATLVAEAPQHGFSVEQGTAFEVRLSLTP